MLSKMTVFTKNMDPNLGRFDNHHPFEDFKNSSAEIPSLPKTNFVIPVYIDLESTGFAVLVITVTVLGLIGNAATFLKILCDKAFHKPAYIVIATLTVADFVALLLYIIHAFIEKFRKEDAEFNGRLFMTTSYGTTHASAAHVVLLLGLRYFAVVEPFKARHLNTRNIISASILIWIFSILFGILYFIFRFLFNDGKIDIVVLSFRGYLLVTPCCFMVYFHIQKVRHLKHSDIINNTRIDRHVKRMSKMILVILVVYILSALLFPVCFILKYYNICSDEDECRHLLISARIMWLINSSVNPLIYFIFSHRIQKKLSLCFNVLTYKQSKSLLKRNSSFRMATYRSSATTGLDVYI